MGTSFHFITINIFGVPAHSQTMIDAYNFIHSNVPEIDPQALKTYSKYVTYLISIG